MKQNLFVKWVNRLNGPRIECTVLVLRIPDIELCVKIQRELKTLFGPSEKMMQSHLYSICFTNSLNNMYAQSTIRAKMNVAIASFINRLFLFAI